MTEPTAATRERVSRVIAHGLSISWTDERKRRRGFRARIGLLSSAHRQELSAIITCQWVNLLRVFHAWLTGWRFTLRSCFPSIFYLQTPSFKSYAQMQLLR